MPFLCVVILAILSKSRTAMVVILVQAIVAFFLAYYYYKDFRKYFNDLGKKLIKTGCRCDRKEHTVNTKIKKSNLF